MLRQKWQNQRCNFIIQIFLITIMVDKININLVFECVEIEEFNFNSHVFQVMYQETRFLNQDACFLVKKGDDKFWSALFSRGSEIDFTGWNIERNKIFECNGRFKVWPLSF